MKEYKLEIYAHFQSQEKKEEVLGIMKGLYPDLTVRHQADFDFRVTVERDIGMFDTWEELADEIHKKLHELGVEGTLDVFEYQMSYRFEEEY